MYGNMWAIPTPDLHRTDYLVVLGGNPQASQGSLLACPDMLGELDAIRARGGKVVVDRPAPHRHRASTPTSGSRSVPGTDAALLLAIVHVLFAEGLVDLGALAELVNGRRRRARAGRGLHARGGRARLRHPRRRRSAARARARDAPTRGRLRPHRHLQRRSSARSRRGSSTS